MLLLQLLSQQLVFTCFWQLYLFHEIFVLNAMPTGQAKKAIAKSFESNSDKAYAGWDNRQRLQVDLESVAMGHLNLLLGRGNLNLVIWDSSGVSLFFSLCVSTLLAVQHLMLFAIHLDMCLGVKNIYTEHCILNDDVLYRNW